MAETGAITVYLRDIELLEQEAERRAKEKYGSDYDIFLKENRTELLTLRKDILHEIVSKNIIKK